MIISQAIEMNDNFIRVIDDVFLGDRVHLAVDRGESGRLKKNVRHCRSDEELSSFVSQCQSA